MSLLLLVEKDYQIPDKNNTLFGINLDKSSDFAFDYRDIEFRTKPTFGNISECSVTRIGDILLDLFITLELPKLDKKIKWIKNIGEKIIKKMYIKMGINHLGQNILVEEFDNDFVHINNELRLSNDKKNIHKQLISLNDNTLTIPLKFFFNKYDTQNLQLISLLYTEIIIGISFEKIHNLIVKENLNDNYNLHQYDIIKSHLTGNYVYLESKVRRYLAQTPNSSVVETVDMREFNIENDDIIHQYHTSQAYEYLSNNNIGIFGLKDIHKMIFSYLGYMNPNIGIKHDFSFVLNFQGPVKELIWVIVPMESNEFEYSDMIQRSKILVQNNQHIIDKTTTFFTNYQQSKYHTNHRENVNVYSFCLYPEQLELSGYAKFGTNNYEKNLHISVLCPSDKLYKLKVYAVQYKHFTISQGVGTLIDFPTLPIISNSL